MHPVPNRAYLRIALVAAALAAAVVVRLSLDRFHYLRSGGGRADEAQVQMTLAQALYKQRRLSDARSAFEKAAQLAPKDARPCNWLTTMALEADRPDLALQSIDESLKRNANDSSVWRAAGDVFLKLGEKREALKSYRQATIVNSSDSAAWKNLGILETSIEPGDSISDLRRAAALSPDDFETEIALGQAALDAGDIATAGPVLRKALALQPADPRALLASARFAMMTDISSETLKRAGDQIDAAMQSGPSPMAYLLRGRLRLLQRRYTVAIADLNEAIHRSPELPAPHAYLSQAYAASHRTALARREADTFARLSARSRAGAAPRGSSNP